MLNVSFELTINVISVCFSCALDPGLSNISFSLTAVKLCLQNTFVMAKNPEENMICWF